MKKLVSLLLAILLLAAIPCAAFADEPAAAQTAAERGLAALQATGRAGKIQLPKEESYLSEWKTLYARKAFKAPCLAVEPIPKYPSHMPTMPYLYEGVEATVVAEEDDMSCIIYRGNNNKQYCGWIKSIRLLEEFPGEQYTVGEKPDGELRCRDDITVTWSPAGTYWVNTYQSHSVLSEEVKDCIGFTFEYQIIAENTPHWSTILGPRKIYVKSGGKWQEVGEFPYPDFGAVRVQVWLDEPMDIEAVGSIAQCKYPEIFYFRQTVTDFAFRES